MAITKCTHDIHVQLFIFIFHVTGNQFDGTYLAGYYDDFFVLWMCVQKFM